MLGHRTNGHGCNGHKTITHNYFAHKSLAHTLIVHKRGVLKTETNYRIMSYKTVHTMLAFRTFSSIKTNSSCYVVHVEFTFMYATNMPIGLMSISVIKPETN